MNMTLKLRNLLYVNLSVYPYLHIDFSSEFENTFRNLCM